MVSTYIPPPPIVTADFVRMVPSIVPALDFLFRISHILFLYILVVNGTIVMKLPVNRKYLTDCTKCNFVQQP